MNREAVQMPPAEGVQRGGLRGRSLGALLLTGALLGAALAQTGAPGAAPSPAPPASSAQTPATGPAGGGAQPGEFGEPLPGEGGPGEGAPAPATSSSPADEPTVHERAGQCVEGSEQSCMSLNRQTEDGEERRILVIRTGTTDDTGIYTVCGPQDDDPEDAPNLGVFSESGPGGIRIVIDKNVIQVPLATVTQRPAGEGEEGSDGRVEASAGRARLLDAAPEGQTDRLARCGVEVTPRPTPGAVKVTQGRTRLTGKSLVYDETDGKARIDGPVAFTRADQDDPLSGESARIEIDVDSEATVLVGNVVLRSEGGRVSKAGRVEYDDEASTARLFASEDQPAESVQGGDVLRVTRGVILYDLEKNEVYADAGEGGTISGEFQDEESGEPGAPSAPVPDGNR